MAIQLGNLPSTASALVDGQGRATPVLQQFFAAIKRGFAAVPAGGATKVLIPLFAHYTTSGTSSVAETDLYSDTLAAGQLAANGDTIYVDFTTQYAPGAATRRVRLYFGGTVIYDSTAIAGPGNSTLTGRATIVREDASTVRCSVQIVVSAAGYSTSTVASYTRITGLTLSNTQIVKLTGQSSVVTADNITAVSEVVSYLPAP